MNILIVEDEIRIAKLLENQIRELLGSKLKKLSHCQYLAEANNFINKYPLDLLFLDLNLKGENGFDLLQKFTALPFQTVIVSAYKDQAIEAFEFGVLDFIPKPFNKKRLQKTLDRLFHHSTDQGKGLKYIAVKKKGRIVSLPLSEILFIQADGHYTELHTASQYFICNKSMDSLEILLPKQFIRIHRSYLVDLNRIEEIQKFPGSKYQILLKNGKELPVSRKGFKLLDSRFI